MPNIWIKKNGKEHGEYEFIEDNTDLKNLIEITMGREVGNLVQELIDSADETQRRLDTDLEYYEGQLESYRSDCSDIEDTVDKIINEINDFKRLDKNSILSKLNEIRRTIKNM